MRRFPFVIAGIVALAIAAAAPAKAFTLHVACYGGVFTAVQEKYAGALFTARSGIKIEWINGNPFLKKRNSPKKDLAGVHIQDRVDGGANRRFPAYLLRGFG